MSVFGIAIGVMALIVVLSVMNGFEDDIKTKILGTQSHIVISHYAGGIEDTADVITRVEQDPSVLGATPFVLGQGLVSTPGGVRGAVVRGIDPESAVRVIRLKDIITAGSIDGLGETGVLMGSELAMQTGVRVGDTIRLISPSGTMTPLGMIPKATVYEVRGLFTTGMYEYDSNMVYLTLPAAQNLFSQERPTGIEIKVDDIYAAETIARRIMMSLGSGYWAKTWKDMNRSLFSALRMEKTVMFIIMLFIVLVAGFSIVSTLIMLVMEKRRDIAILKSMGATTRQILNIFVSLGFVIGLAGTALGVCCGVLLATHLDPVIAAVEWLFHVEVMPRDVYYITGLPSKIIPSEVGLIAAFALVLSFFSALYPARQAARQDPVEVMRHES